MQLSAVLDRRLDDLVALLNREGDLVARIYRHDLIAALIASAPESVSDLQKLMDDYVALNVRDAMVGEAKGAPVIELRPAKPGRRPA